MDDPGAELRLAIQDVLPSLRRMTDGDASHKPSPEKWSPKEVIGHLIDSASNNHGRFVRGMLQDDLVFPGYDQDAWVNAQQYANHSWEDLLALWAQFNLHIARVMERVPENVRKRSRSTHNLHEIGFRKIDEGDAVTLHWLMEDYVEHLQHHLRQIHPSKS
jgi:hypothetical protein